ncbi:6-bladed beta-propeller [Algoriphagus yeomjeoni]|uniref:6-bladed beta-propeller n=1 Tax=Algoriphagus yeomjeoni TaxID=291403 RepID=UPI003CE48B0A
MSKYILFVLIGFIIFSCAPDNSDSENHNFSTIKLNTEFTESVDFISDTTFIPLEFCDDCIIGDISRILKVPDGFIISDKRITKRVLKFNNDGGFEFVIGTQGDGLGNYVLPFDISLIPETNRLAVLDQNQRKIIIYSLLDGNFIEEIPINFQAKSLQFISPDLIAVHFDGQFSGKELDYLGGILDLQKKEFIYQGVLDFSKTDQNITGGDFLFGSKDLLFSKSFNDTIYRVGEDGFYPKYLIDFGDKSVSDEIKKLPLMDMRMRLMREVPFYHNGNFIENEKFLFFLWWGEDEFENFTFYDKKHNQTLNYQGKNVIFKRPFYINDDYMLSYLMNDDYERMGVKQQFFGLSQNQVIIKISFSN